MTTHKAIHNSFTIERTYPQSAAKVWSAMKDPKKKRRWFADGAGCAVSSYDLDFSVGGFERTRFRFGDGPAMTNDTIFLDLVENERVVFAYSMTMGGAPLSASLATMELSPVKEGTRVVFTEHTTFLDGKDGGAGRRQGTIGLFERLAGELAEHD